MAHKVCSGCRETKSVSAFCKNKRARDGLNTYCRPCAHARDSAWRKAHPEVTRAAWKAWYGRASENREQWSVYTRRSNLKRYSGLTITEYDRLFSEQQGRCAICRQQEVFVKHGKVCRLAVDHDHASGEIRGLLCRKCNNAIGLLGDSTDRMYAAMQYLAKYQRPALGLVRIA